MNNFTRPKQIKKWPLLFNSTAARIIAVIAAVGLVSLAVTDNLGVFLQNLMEWIKQLLQIPFVQGFLGGTVLMVLLARKLS